MNVSSSSKPPFSCIRCFERKTKCDKQNPCSSCVRHNSQCTPRPRKPSRRARVANGGLMDERLRLYEAVLREQGIDPEQITGTLRIEVRPQSIPLESPENARQSPADTDVSEVQSTVFTPQLIHGQGGRELTKPGDSFVSVKGLVRSRFVDNNLWSRLAEEVSKYWLFRSSAAKETKRETNSLHTKISRLRSSLQNLKIASRFAPSICSIRLQTRRDCAKTCYVQFSEYNIAGSLIRIIGFADEFVVPRERRYTRFGLRRRIERRCYSRR